MNLLLKNGFILDFNDNLDILIEGGRIAKIQKALPPSGYKVFDCDGKIITPGLIDLHSHIRAFEGGDEETIESVVDAAIRGGFTTICIMPNTNPPLDRPEVLRRIKEKTKNAKIQVFPIGAIAKEMGQIKLADIEGMKKGGIFAISDDGFPIKDKHLLKSAMEVAKGLSLLVILHCEDNRFSGNLAEVKSIERNLSLALDTKCRLHIAHISTKDGISLVKDAKRESQDITTEATPHHFALSDIGFNVRPPIRGKKDQEAVIEGLCSGVIDVIATDHAPHKDPGRYGVSGIETALGLVITNLVEGGYLSLEDAISKLTKAPSRIIGIERGIKEGGNAYLTIISLKEEWVVEKLAFSSKGKNTPFDGLKLKGRAISVITPNISVCV